MVKYYDSIPSDLHQWALQQKLFFTASAPWTGKHINLSPKGVLNSSFSIFHPNQVAYVDLTGSGNETISHIRENGRVTVMFCSFDPEPRILRFFCYGKVVEWIDPTFQPLLDRMGGGQDLHGIRAIIVLDVFKVQTSCGYAVPLLSLTPDTKTGAPTPSLTDRDTLTKFAIVKEKKGQMDAYRAANNVVSLDGLPGLNAARIDVGERLWVGDLKLWLQVHREVILVLVTVLVSVLGTLVGLRKLGLTTF